MFGAFVLWPARRRYSCWVFLGYMSPPPAPFPGVIFDNTMPFSTTPCVNYRHAGLHKVRRRRLFATNTLTPHALPRMLHERPFGLPEICFPSGQAFCTLVRAKSRRVVEFDSSCSEEDDGYEMRDLSGRTLCTVCGDFPDKVVNVLSPTGQLICATEPCTLPFDDRRHYQVWACLGVALLRKSMQ